MLLDNVKQELNELLYQALLQDIDYIKQNFKQDTIIAYAVYCDSGFRNFGTAACTEKNLIAQAKELVEKGIESNEESAQLYVATFAAEWDYYNDYQNDSFIKLNELNQKIANADNEGKIAGVNTPGDFNYNLFFQFYIDTIIEVMQKLKISGLLDGSPFCKDTLLGLQFGSPDEDEREWILQVSAKLNNNALHDKMIESYEIN